jgi:hypothetical protein
MSAETDSPDGEHGSEAEAEAEKEKESQEEPGFEETLEGVVFDSPLVIRAEGPALQTTEVRERGGTIRNYDLTVEQEVQVDLSVPIMSTGDLEDALLGSNHSRKASFNAEEAVRWGLEQIGREDLSITDIQDWVVEVTAKPTTYIKVANQRGDLDLKVKRGGPGLTPDPADVLEALEKKGVFCDSLLLALAEVRKHNGEDYQDVVSRLQESEQDD